MRPYHPTFVRRLGTSQVLPVPSQLAHAELLSCRNHYVPGICMGGKFVPILQLGKTEPRGSKGKAGIARMAQPFRHPEHHLCQQIRVGGSSQGGSPGPGKLGVLGVGGNFSARNQHTSTSIPSLGCAQVVRKKKMINKDKWRRAEHAGNPSPSFLLFPKQIKL